MKKRNLLKNALFLAALGYVARLGLLTAVEWRRENKMRAMSDEGPLSAEIPKLLREAFSQEREFVRELGLLVVKFPLELARYMRLESL